MPEERVHRRLAAILAADVAGYSRLMERDEAGTLAVLKDRRRNILTPLVGEHDGRIIKVMGDGVLVEFASAVNAVACAVELQNRMAAANSSVAADKRIDLRMGVNLGDVIAEGGDLYGDGVNVAARLQALADIGGVMISGAVYDQVENKLAIGFEPLGEQQMKNIDRPVRTYRVLAAPAAGGRKPRAAPKPRNVSRRLAVTAGTLLLLVAAAGAAWFTQNQRHFEPSLPLPDKPSIAVLPFTNMTNDPNEAYFADGISDDLITDLSRISGLFVIGRNSTFAYRGKAIDVRNVAQELGVRYVLQGSVQRAGDRVRINAQLVDAATGGHQWAERYDGTIADIFALQDKVTNAIADSLALRLTDAERLVLHQDETGVPAAYEAFLRGWEYFRRTTPEDYAKAVPEFENAIALDPGYGRAYAALSRVYAQMFLWRWHSRLGITRSEAEKRARQFLAKAQNYPTALSHQVAGIMFQTQWQHPQALAEIKEAIAQEPGESWNYAFMSWVLSSSGQPAEALAHIRTAIRLDPNCPAFFMYLLGHAEFGQAHYAEAAAALERGIEINPEGEYLILLLASAYGHLGRDQDAATAIAQYNKIRVGWGDAPATIASTPPYDYAKYADSDRFYQGLKLAGLPATADDAADAKDRLTGDAVRELFLGHRLQGRTYETGEDHAVSVTAEGSATLSGDWGNAADAKIELSNEQLCYVRSGGIRFCGMVARNPGGSSATENDYLWIDTRRAFTFTQVE